MNPDAVLRDLDGLRALARSLVHGDAEADDLLQDTAIAAITHPPDTDRPTRPWLATVLRNRWKMNRRAESRRKAREQAVAPDERPDAAVDDPIDRARVLERLSTALVALDEPFRSTVIRRYLDGDSAADIARAQGVPAGTVRWRLKTGLERLRASLDESTPRWQRALVPLAAGKGVLAVKAKTSILAVLAVLLLLGAVVIALVIKQGGDTTRAAAPAASAGRSAAIAQAGSAGSAAPIVATAETVTDPLPGQGRATLEVIEAAGGAVSGRVINWSTGDGVANAELTFTADAGASTVHTREDGTFELAPAAPGRFSLTAVVAAGYLPYAPELLHSNVQVDLARNSAIRGITVFLFPAVDYYGKVIDTKGAPVAGARVRLLGTPSAEQVIEKLETEWTSGKDGTFVFHAADDAVFEAVRGKARGWARLDGDVAITKQMTIEVADVAARDATIRGKTVNEAGEPVADVLIRAFPQERPGRPPDDVRAPAYTISGADGAFALEGVDTGMYRLEAETDERAPVAKDGVPGGASGVGLVMKVGEPLAGTVVTTGGEPVPAYTLLVVRRTGIRRELVIARSIIEPTGAFSVRVAPGEYELLASASGWAPSKPTVARAGTTNAQLVVSAGATLRGTVVATDGSPVPYARIMREAPAGGASAQPANAGTVTRTDGSFELTGIPPGPVSFTVGAGGFHPKIEAGLTATDGATLGPVTIALTKLADGEKPVLELAGIGVKLAGEVEGLRVDMVVPDSGAADAGIVVGDLLVAVDGAPVTELGMDGAVAKIRGVVGTKLSVSIQRGEQIVPLLVERKKLRM